MIIICLWINFLYIFKEFDSNVKSDKMYRFQIGKSKVIKVCYVSHEISFFKPNP
jgi:hypothetical protein